MLLYRGAGTGRVSTPLPLHHAPAGGGSSSPSAPSPTAAFGLGFARKLSSEFDSLDTKKARRVPSCARWGRFVCVSLAYGPCATSCARVLLAAALALAALVAGLVALHARSADPLFWDLSLVAESLRLTPPALAWEGVASRASVAHPDELSDARVLCVCHPDWTGIRAATYAQGEPVLELPGVLSRAHGERLVSFLSSLPSLELLVINGIPPRTLELAATLRSSLPRLRIVFIYHGAPSNAFHLGEEARLLNSLILAAQKGVVERVGVVKPGLERWLQDAGVPTALLWNFPAVSPFLPAERFSAADGQLHVGVFTTPNDAHKNTLTQMLAVCSIPGAVLHVSRLPPEVPYLRRLCSAGLVEHGFLPQRAFLRLLSQMDVTSYASHSECFPMVVVQSLTAGVPCITSATSAIYNADPLLYTALVEPQVDNPTALADRIMGVAARREALSLRSVGLVSWLHRRAGMEWARMTRAPGAQGGGRNDGSGSRRGSGDAAREAAAVAGRGAGGGARDLGGENWRGRFLRRFATRGSSGWSGGHWGPAAGTWVKALPPPPGVAGAAGVAGSDKATGGSPGPLLGARPAAWEEEGGEGKAEEGASDASAGLRRLLLGEGGGGEMDPDSPHLPPGALDVSSPLLPYAPSWHRSSALPCGGGERAGGVGATGNSPLVLATVLAWFLPPAWNAATCALLGAAVSRGSGVVLLVWSPPRDPSWLGLHCPEAAGAQAASDAYFDALFQGEEGPLHEDAGTEGQGVASAPTPPLLTVLHVKALLAEAAREGRHVGPGVPCRHSPYPALQRARDFALAVHVAYGLAPFGVLDVPETGGLPFELLRQANSHRASSGAPDVGRYTGVLGAGGSGGGSAEDEKEELFLPRGAVHVSVRLVGSLQLASQAEGRQALPLRGAEDVDDATTADSDGAAAGGGGARASDRAAPAFLRLPWRAGSAGRNNASSSRSAPNTRVTAAAVAPGGPQHPGPPSGGPNGPYDEDELDSVTFNAERFVLATAPTLVAPSAPMADFYGEVYKMERSTICVLPPPMADPVSGGPAPGEGSQQGSTAGGNGNGPLRVLMLGDLMPLLGADVHFVAEGLRSTIAAIAKRRHSGKLKAQQRGGPSAASAPDSGAPPPENNDDLSSLVGERVHGLHAWLGGDLTADGAPADDDNSSSGGGDRQERAGGPQDRGIAARLFVLGGSGGYCEFRRERGLLHALHMDWDPWGSGCIDPAPVTLGGLPHVVVVEGVPLGSGLGGGVAAAVRALGIDVVVAASRADVLALSLRSVAAAPPVPASSSAVELLVSDIAAHRHLEGQTPATAQFFSPGNASAFSDALQRCLPGVVRRRRGQGPRSPGASSGGTGAGGTSPSDPAPLPAEEGGGAAGAVWDAYLGLLLQRGGGSSSALVDGSSASVAAAGGAPSSLLVPLDDAPLEVALQRAELRVPRECAGGH